MGSSPSFSWKHEVEKSTWQTPTVRAGVVQTSVSFVMLKATLGRVTSLNQHRASSRSNFPNTVISVPPVVWTISGVRWSGADLAPKGCQGQFSQYTDDTAPEYCHMLPENTDTILRVC